MKPFRLTSAAFANGKPIPAKYTCDGSDVSPPLQWEGAPHDTHSLALIVNDPDAPVGTWVHWVLYDIPPELRALMENVPPNDELPNGSRHGQNSWRRPGYGGPCPPGGTHRYFFELYALDARLDLPARATKKQVLQAMEGHILIQTELMGTYARR
jgi:Raf kinase inhibitor-like YbhB/YbcL family protein